MAPVCLALALLPLLENRPHQKRNLLPSPSSPISRINQTPDFLSTSSPPRLVTHKQSNNPEYYPYSHRPPSTSLSSSLGAPPPATQPRLVSARPPNSSPRTNKAKPLLPIIVPFSRLVLLRPFKSCSLSNYLHRYILLQPFSSFSLCSTFSFHFAS